MVGLLRKFGSVAHPEYDTSTEIRVDSSVGNGRRGWRCQLPASFATSERTATSYVTTNPTAKATRTRTMTLTSLFIPTAAEVVVPAPMSSKTPAEPPLVPHTRRASRTLDGGNCGCDYVRNRPLSIAGTSLAFAGRRHGAAVRIS